MDVTFHPVEPKILVVDDTEDNLDLLEFALKRKPVTMLRATSGAECLVLAERENPDVILLDIQMPEMDGYETFKRLRANPKTAKIPVVFLTAQKKDPESIEKGLALGVDEYLTKPIDVEELFVRTRMLVQLKRAQAELERTKADFMAMLVHDLRSPLSGIQSVVKFIKEVSKEGPLKEEYLKLLDAAEESSHRMLELINDFLDLSKFEAGSMTLERHPTSITELLRRVINQMELQFQRRNIAIKTNFDEHLPLVLVDERKIEQVVVNLLSNALKFAHPDTSVIISAERMDATELGQRPLVRVSVSDKGLGIPAHELPLLFERYKQVSTASKVKQKGTGLGLAICKLIVEAHEGSISAESEPNQWTTFRFTLPALQD
jgi:two-component system sensor histidine kinase/response regulator